MPEWRTIQEASPGRSAAKHRKNRVSSRVIRDSRSMPEQSCKVNMLLKWRSTVAAQLKWHKSVNFQIFITSWCRAFRDLQRNFELMWVAKQRKQIKESNTNTEYLQRTIHSSEQKWKGIKCWGTSNGCFVPSQARQCDSEREGPSTLSAVSYQQRKQRHSVAFLSVFGCLPKF